MKKVQLRFRGDQAFGGKKLKAGDVIMTGEIPDDANPLKLKSYVTRDVLEFVVEETKKSGEKKSGGGR